MTVKTKSPVKVKLVAAFFIKKASAVYQVDADNDLTNLKLQKILFYAQAEYYKKYKKLLFAEKIRAWKYGPVVVEVYDWLKECGAYNITDFDVSLPESNLPKEIRDFLEEIWQKYSKYSAGYLVEKTHAKDSVWEKAGKKDDKLITEDMLDHVDLADNGW